MAEGGNSGSNGTDLQQPGTGPLQRFLERFEVILLLGGLGSFFLSFTALGWLPARALREQIRKRTPAEMRSYTPVEAAGFQVYAQNGCGYCHSQLVRSIASDTRRFGPASEAWEFRFDYPHIWGTRRVGPDLARESGAHPDSWQYAHLFNPRSVTPQSVMPSYRWMFARTRDGRYVPGAEARALVAYLNYLGRAMKKQPPPADAGISAMGPSDGTSGGAGMVRSDVAGRALDLLFGAGMLAICVYGGLWLSDRRLREEIERPKYRLVPPEPFRGGKTR